MQPLSSCKHTPFLVIIPITCLASNSCSSSDTLAKIQFWYPCPRCWEGSGRINVQGQIMIWGVEVNGNGGKNVAKEAEKNAEMVED